jgi:hypothetical protein
MYIKEKFLHSEFDDPRLHLKDMLKATLEDMQALYQKHPQLLKFYDSVDTLHVISEFADSYGISNDILLNNSYNEAKPILNVLNKYYSDVVSKETSTQYKNIFSKKIYTFSDEEFESVQDSINKLRTKLQKTKDLDENHKERLLKKLEELQKELHKKMSSFDKFLGGFISIAHTLGASSKEAKPFTDDVKDILDITLNVESRGENLPESNNQITNNSLFQIEHTENI